MQFQHFSFGKIRIDGIEYGYDIVIDRGEIGKRKKKPSKKFRDAFWSYAALTGGEDTVEMQSFGSRHGHRSTARDG